MNPYYHAVSSVKKYGGKVEDYITIHSWFDESKSFIADFRHRALRHHAQGIFQCEEKYGKTITNSDGKVVPVRFIGEQHVKEDLGRIPSVQDWFSCIKTEAWMMKPSIKKELTISKMEEIDVDNLKRLNKGCRCNDTPCYCKELLPLEDRRKFD